MRIVIVVELSLFFIKHTAVSLNENCKVISLQKNKRRSIRLLQIISVLLVIVHVYSLKSQIILIPYLTCLFNLLIIVLSLLIAFLLQFSLKLNKLEINRIVIFFIYKLEKV